MFLMEHKNITQTEWINNHQKCVVGVNVITVFYPSVNKPTNLKLGTSFFRNYCANTSGWKIKYTHVGKEGDFLIATDVPCWKQCICESIQVKTVIWESPWRDWWCVFSISLGCSSVDFLDELTHKVNSFFGGGLFRKNTHRCAVSLPWNGLEERSTEDGSNGTYVIHWQECVTNRKVSHNWKELGQNFFCFAYTWKKTFPNLIWT